MYGSLQVRFSELFADTCSRHGVAWAMRYYTKRGMSRLEFGIWLAGYNR